MRAGGPAKRKIKLVWPYKGETTFGINTKIDDLLRILSLSVVSNNPEFLQN